MAFNYYGSLDGKGQVVYEKKFKVNSNASMDIGRAVTVNSTGYLNYITTASEKPQYITLSEIPSGKGEYVDVMPVRKDMLLIVDVSDSNINNYIPGVKYQVETDGKRLSSLTTYPIFEVVSVDSQNKKVVCKLAL
jgi:hypothetical protein